MYLIKSNEFEMHKKLGVALSLLLILCVSANAQTTETFDKIDSKHGFKDIFLGTSYSLLKSKMGLKKVGVEASPNQYTITDKKYLSIGDFIVSRGIAYFSKNKLYDISLDIDLNNALTFEQVLNYLSDLFGVPVYQEGIYWWLGKKLTYALSEISETNTAQIGITSNIVKFDEAVSNF